MNNNSWTSKRNFLKLKRLLSLLRCISRKMPKKNSMLSDLHRTFCIENKTKFKIAKLKIVTGLTYQLRAALHHKKTTIHQTRKARRKRRKAKTRIDLLQMIYNLF